jgi:hypothetical protein
MRSRYAIELTGQKHLRMEYQFISTAAFQVPADLGTELSLLIFGFMFQYPEEFPDLCLALPERIRSRLPTELYYFGWSKLTFQDVKGGKIEVWPYEPKFPPADQIINMNPQGSAVKLMREWPIDTNAAGIEYILECSLEQPYGSMRLQIKANGPVTLSVDPEEFMLSEDVYGKREYGFDITRRKQLDEI